MFIKENVNPKKRKTGDCSTRALTKALKLPYTQVLQEQCNAACELFYGITDSETIDKVLIDHGFIKAIIGKMQKGQKRPTVKDIAKKTEFGEFSVAVCRVSNHFTVCENGNVYDIWDCSDKSVYAYWYK